MLIQPLVFVTIQIRILNITMIKHIKITLDFRDKTSEIISIYCQGYLYPWYIWKSFPALFEDENWNLFNCYRYPRVGSRSGKNRIRKISLTTSIPDTDTHKSWHNARPPPILFQKFRYPTSRPFHNIRNWRTSVGDPWHFWCGSGSPNPYLWLTYPDL